MVTHTALNWQLWAVRLDDKYLQTDMIQLYFGVKEGMKETYRKCTFVGSRVAVDPRYGFVCV